MFAVYCIIYVIFIKLSGKGKQGDYIADEETGIREGKILLTLCVFGNVAGECTKRPTAVW